MTPHFLDEDPPVEGSVLDLGEEREKVLVLEAPVDGLGELLGISRRQVAVSPLAAASRLSASCFSRSSRRCSSVRPKGSTTVEFPFVSGLPRDTVQQIGGRCS